MGEIVITWGSGGFKPFSAGLEPILALDAALAIALLRCMVTRANTHD
ncbi:hypothetical protein LJR168_002025 [Pseudoxanthomonas sp. LjRoot168]